MSVFVDSSALLAVMVSDDDGHEQATRTWRALVTGDDVLVTTNYVLVETYSILQRRHGLRFVELLRDAAVPEMQVHWITPAQHEAAVSEVVSSGRRRLSLVDCSSFVVMRDLGISRAFALDAHFGEDGYELVTA